MELTFCFFHSFLTTTLKVAAFVSCRSVLQHPVGLGAHQRRAIVQAQCFRYPLSLLCKSYGAATMHPPMCHACIWSHSVDIASLSHCCRKYRYKNGNRWDLPNLKTFFPLCEMTVIEQWKNRLGFASIHQNLFPFPRNLFWCDKIYGFLSNSLY